MLENIARGSALAQNSKDLLWYRFLKKKMGMKKRKRQDGEEDFEFDPTPRHLVEAHIKEQEKRLIVVLEGAQLESIAVS